MDEMQVNVTQTESYGAIDCFGRVIDAGIVFQFGGEDGVATR